MINDNEWIVNKFYPTVQKRGAEIIAARGASSAASAGSAGIDHIHDWVLGTKGKWTSMAIPSDGSYGVPAGVYFSYPVVCEGGKYKKVTGLDINEHSAQMLEKTKKELFEERDAVKHLIP